METDLASHDAAQVHASDRLPVATTVSRARWWMHLGLISGYIGVSGVLGWIRGARSAPALSSSAGRLMLVGVTTLAVFACVFGLAWLASRASRDDLLLRWRGGFWTVPLGVGYSVALRLILAAVVLTVVVVLLLTRVVPAESLGRLALQRAPRVEALLDISAMRSDPLYFWLTVTFVSFAVAGLREELWRAAFLAGLRALWPRRFGSRTGQIGAVLIASAVFGFGHMSMGPTAVCLAGVLGFGLGLIMVLHRSIWPAVIAHGAFDATTMALIPWAMERLHHARQLLGQ